MKVCMRGFFAPFTAAAAACTSSLLVRASPAMIGPSTLSATSLTASKSPGDAAGKPASMTSTFILASCAAICSFSSVFRLIPGACSPSLRVVSKMRT